MNPLLAGIGPFGTTELIIIAVLLGFMALVAGGIIFLVVYLTKKKQ
jgi:hypothetical protein